jgi:phage baseplate assembly protein W
MSFDLKLSQRCPHLSVQAATTIANDGKTLVLPYPIGSFGLVRVYANGIEIPSGGLYRPPSIQSSSRGPFTVTPSNSTLTITTSSSTETFAIPTGASVSQSQVLSVLQTSTIVDTENQQGVITLTPKSVNDQYLRLTGCASEIGFQQAGSNAALVYPGWRLVSSQQNGVYTKSIQFRSNLRANPVLTATYPFEPSQCPRCRSTQVENDFRFTESGALETITDETLLIQESLKILLTDLGSNPYHPWYGTRIRQRIGSKNVTGTAATLQEDVRDALNRYKNLQVEQAQYQTLTPRQRLSSIDSIQVLPIEGLPTAFEINIVVRNSSSQPITVSSIFTVPGVINLSA